MIGPRSLPRKASAVAALAGRRIDAPDTKEARFPAVEEARVAGKLLARFRAERVAALVCAAACGADILALEAAERLGIPALVVLPFSAGHFRSISVTDRPGNWGKRFDRLIEAARTAGALIELGYRVDDEQAFLRANRRIVEEAAKFDFSRRLAFAIWEGRARDGDDLTADFLSRASEAGFEERTILTKRKEGD
jgi:hypothetical protein